MAFFINHNQISWYYLLSLMKCSWQNWSHMKWLICNIHDLKIAILMGHNLCYGNTTSSPEKKTSLVHYCSIIKPSRFIVIYDISFWFKHLKVIYTGSSYLQSGQFLFIISSHLLADTEKLLQGCIDNEFILNLVKCKRESCCLGHGALKSLDN